MDYFSPSGHPLKVAQESYRRTKKGFNIKSEEY
jgi:hypothetical protein